MTGIDVLRLSGVSAMLSSTAVAPAAASAGTGGNGSSNGNSGIPAVVDQVRASSTISPSVVAQFSSLGLAMSAGAAQEPEMPDTLYASSGLSMAASLGQGARTIPQGAVADRALVSALMLALVNQNMQDMTSAMALQTNPALSGLSVTT